MNFNKIKQNQGMRIIYGIHAVEEAIEVGTPKLLMLSGNSYNILAKKAAQKNIPIERKLSSELDLFVNNKNHQGAVAIVEGYKYKTWDELKKIIAQIKNPLVVFLDRIEDPANLGAIIRSAYLFGAAAVVIPFKKSASVTAGTVKSAVGATEYLPVCRVINLGKTLGELREEGFMTIAATMNSEIKPLDPDFNLPVALVIGSESKGIRPSVLKQCDVKISIPMKGIKVGSLNASVAAAVLIYSIQIKKEVL